LFRMAPGAIALQRMPVPPSEVAIEPWTSLRVAPLAYLGDIRLSPQ
jgi:hypothetical protein